MPGRWWRLQEQPASPHSRGGGASLCLCLDPRPRWEASEATVRPENKQLFSSQSLGHRAFPEGEGLSGGQGDGAVRLHRSPQYWGGQDPAQAPRLRRKPDSRPRLPDPVRGTEITPRIHALHTAPEQVRTRRGPVSRPHLGEDLGLDSWWEGARHASGSVLFFLPSPIC